MVLAGENKLGTGTVWRMDEPMNGRTDEWTDGQTDGEVLLIGSLPYPRGGYNETLGEGPNEIGPFWVRNPKKNNY